ncbi:riboflavin kinase [Paenarthrobacter sp. AT5]|uniref:riboflavin kinase n=1 Tax=Paenarthrobacter TaxID=1742992 RepID=UPI001A97FAF5|nr:MULTISPECIES: riboflavin kinase [Paenarthrobacter]QSZ53921.1 hypothetical protein AYX19_13595 [Paenarthrobacter ureafaciens]WOC62702.1 riboflavin kinase [Paenarthrobacter sp. AT5]
MARTSIAGTGSGISDTFRFRIEGTVEHGDARGRRLGFPTASITVPDEEIRDGVWASKVCLRSKGKDETYAAAVSIGRRPTYCRKGTRLLHLLDYTGDLYGRNIEVTLYAHIRAQRSFRGPDELATQIRGDVVRVRSWAAAALQSMEDRTGESAAPRGIQQAPSRACYSGAPAPGPACPDASASDSHETPHRAMPLDQVEWGKLINALVEVRRYGRVNRTGIVEDAMPDSSVLWIAADANDPRQLFDASQGHQVWVTPRQLPGALRYRMTADQFFKPGSAQIV